LLRLVVETPELAKRLSQLPTTGAWVQWQVVDQAAIFSLLDADEAVGPDDPLPCQCLHANIS